MKNIIVIIFLFNLVELIYVWLWLNSIVTVLYSVIFRAVGVLNNSPLETKLVSLLLRSNVCQSFGGNWPISLIIQTVVTYDYLLVLGKFVTCAGSMLECIFMIFWIIHIVIGCIILIIKGNLIKNFELFFVFFLYINTEINTTHDNILTANYSMKVFCVLAFR